MKKFTFLSFLIVATQVVLAQSAFLKRNMDDSYQLERFEILYGKYDDSLHFGNKPLSRKEAVRFLEMYETEHKEDITANDKQEIENFISKHGAEWGSQSNVPSLSKKPILKHFYKYKPDMIRAKEDDNSFYKDNYSLILNPIIAYQQMMETGNTKQNLFVNTKGIEARGTIANRFGFYTMFTDNQERGPMQFQNYNALHGAVVGGGFYKDFKETKPGNARDYIVATGYIDADIWKNKINVSFGYDRFHMGDGYRSLFLSDFSAPYTFLKINTRLWKLNYQNLYMELLPQYARSGDKLLPKKYMTSHRLDVNVKKHWNFGLFESVTFGRKDHFDFGYMNPIILYRSIEQNNGSPDNAIIGLDFKYNTGKKLLFYGQAVLDEFNFSHLKARDGWWANKQGIQLGAKAADVFGIKNLLVQAEFNVVRPFTYSFRDSIADYTHYNQPLAHPYGANFAEASFIVKYKPSNKWYVSLKTFYNKQGRDSSAAFASFGGNIFKSYDLRDKAKSIGNKLFNGYASTVMFANVNASYELRQNLFLDFGVNYRDEKATHKYNPTFNSIQVYTGFRLNAVRRQYDY